MGVLDKIKSVFSDKKEETSNQDVSSNSVQLTVNEKLFEKFVLDARDEIKKTTNSFYNIKLPLLQTTALVFQLSDKQRVDFIIYLVKAIHKHRKSRKDYSNYDDNQIEWVMEAYEEYLLRTKIDLDEDDAENIYQTFSKYKKYPPDSDISAWPVLYFLKRLETKFGKATLPQKLEQTLQALKNELETSKIWDEKKKAKLISEVNDLLNTGNKETVKPVSFNGNDELKTFADETIAALPEKERILWYQLFAIANRETGSKPTAKFLARTREIIDELGEENFKKVVVSWFNFIIKFKEKEQTHSYTSRGREIQYVSYEFLSLPNLDSIKAFVWMCTHFLDSATAHIIANLAERSYRKIPQKGPAAAGLGNACFAALFMSKEMEGISQLTRLKLRIKQSSAQNLIEKYLLQAANEKGVSIYEIEDFSFDDFGLIDGKKEVVFGDYKAELSIVAIGKTEIKWMKPDGQLQKTVPAHVTEHHATELKMLKETAKNIEKMLSVHRDRIDRMFRAGRTMSYEHFTQYYFNQGLISFIAWKLIWNFTVENKTQAAIYVTSGWRNQDGDKIEISPESTVSLWHPAVESVKNVQAWRSFMNEFQLVQPVKQAYREIYLLTDAEIQTKSYSNRMAAHLLKQHQFNMLAKTRGWKYSLIGCYDDGRDNEMAETKLPEYNLKAGFWVAAVEADNAFNDTGIWNYVSTDQIRFTKLDEGATVNLIDVPAIPFSEILRDVDLFVGVASVGNDPEWADSGGALPTYRDYWRAYSFGELSEVAKTRREILEKIVPRLKIGKVAEIKDKFLVVKGKLRTYKIHIGSANILMEPNDQYLCIVPDRREKDYTQNVFLPFEGDNGLSVILSKAFLLADDEKIKDTTITSQINRK